MREAVFREQEPRAIGRAQGARAGPAEIAAEPSRGRVDKFLFAARVDAGQVLVAPRLTIEAADPQHEVAVEFVLSPQAFVRRHVGSQTPQFAWL